MPAVRARRGYLCCMGVLMGKSGSMGCRASGDAGEQRDGKETYGLVARWYARLTAR